MTPERKIAEVKRLVALKWPYRRIAAEVSLSHQTVANIASGKHVQRAEPAQPPSQNYPFPMTFETVRARAREMLIANGREISFEGATP